MASVSHTRGVNLGSINKKYKVCIKKERKESILIMRKSYNNDKTHSKLALSLNK